MNNQFQKTISYSVVIPVFNEEDTIISLYNLLKDTMQNLDGHYEIIFIDDCSIDSTSSKIMGLSRNDENVHYVRFDVNKGQGKAIEEGFRNAKGEVIITMDGDLQNDPRDIPKLISEINNGFDLVCGWRAARQDSLIKIIKSKIGNFFQRSITNLNLHDMSCTFRAYRKEIVAGLKLERKFFFSFLPYIISKKKKINITEVAVGHYPRKFGSTKYCHLPTIIGTVRDYLILIFSREF